VRVFVIEAVNSPCRKTPGFEAATTAVDPLKLHVSGGPAGAELPLVLGVFVLGRVWPAAWAVVWCGVDRHVRGGCGVASASFAESRSSFESVYAVEGLGDTAERSVHIHSTRAS